MGKVIFKFNQNSGKPFIYIKRRIDGIETQEIRMTLSNDVSINTETGNYISINGKDEHCNIVEINLPISIEELKNYLNNYLKEK